ncbi:MAG: NAD(P)H-hydrate dehydratase [Sphingomonas sp.]|uniref:NAD(P)H-hydrate dehydratase n=1 Tax=Sphingomonas sp. TaxID=28214 RepID=UPI001AFFE2ED|nr:NAD(P)H-hydrate dehydratase [Sphingomonas sp.]MBO9624439.1 NAD(P)H-hydrate dehydratase [Sphingomonas sp.]
MIELDSTWLAANPLPEPAIDTDKNERGRVLAAGGSRTVPGALRLPGEAALRAGAGKLQLASVEPVVLALGMTLPEAAVFPLSANDAGELGEQAGEELCAYLERCDTLVLGPGMGAKCPAAAILAPVLARPRDSLSMVLDAAAVAAAGDFAEAIRSHDGRIVLTPHPGEMCKLMDCDAERVAADPAGLAQEAAGRFRAIVALKGPETWVACPGEPVLRYPGGGPGLATGGSGDVLAGIAGGLLARGAPPRAAAAWAVWLHGEAGRRLAERIGPIGFLGRELLAEIPALMAGR